MNAKRFNQRWYDAMPSVTHAVELLMIFPDDLQEVIASGINHLVEHEYQAKEILEDLRSLGTEKVLALYQSKQRKRDYDGNMNVHRAMNYLFVLSIDNLTLVCSEIVGLVGTIEDYLRECAQHRYRPPKDEFELITQTYIEQGHEEAQKLTEKLKQTFMNNLVTVHIDHGDGRLGSRKILDH